MPTTAANSPGTTWFITGTSQAFGLELVKQLLAGGRRVAATARDTARLRENLGEDASSDLFLPLQVDLDTGRTPPDARPARGPHHQHVLHLRSGCPGRMGSVQRDAAEAIIGVASRPPAPLRLLLGSDALRLATQKIENLAAGIEQNKKITLSTALR